MKKTIAVLIAAIAFSTPAFAGNYSDAVETQRVCKETGVTAAGFYQFKQKGLPWEVAIADTNPDPYGKDAQALMYISAEAAWSEHVHSQEDAYMRAWGKCMDRFR